MGGTDGQQVDNALLLPEEDEERVAPPPPHGHDVPRVLSAKPKRGLTARVTDENRSPFHSTLTNTKRLDRVVDWNKIRSHDAGWAWVIWDRVVELRGFTLSRGKETSLKKKPTVNYFTISMNIKHVQWKTTGEEQSQNKAARQPALGIKTGIRAGQSCIPPYC